MKIIRTILLATVLLLVDSSYADPSTMPPPTANGSGTAQANGAPPVGGAPIDQNLVLLMIAGLTLGTVFIYRNKIKKASM